MAAKKAARTRKPAAKSAPRKASAPRKSAKPAPRKAKAAAPKAKPAKAAAKTKSRASAAAPVKAAKPVNATAAPTRAAAPAKPKPPVIPGQVAEGRVTFTGLQARARRQAAIDEDEDGTAAHNLLLGPRNVRPYRIIGIRPRQCPRYFDDARDCLVPAPLERYNSWRERVRPFK